MARPLRLEFPQTLYQVTSRGDGREDIFHTDADGQAWLAVLGQVCQRFNWVVQAYYLMSNHYHLLVQTPEAICRRACANSTGYTPSRSTAHTAT
ncbi:transposase [Polaromonas sp. A23]|uniref:transposase n=1 Tax=Polaromonas sp. A23 TaxID=1944133 RepID=UPI0009D1BD38|nr:transposase [Polaromonas sp. A23]OOG37304.1 hypothetical protein B0B52_18355 [Polaromonas sp. A23]